VKKFDNFDVNIRLERYDADGAGGMTRSLTGTSLIS
jgi:hypothetical protein